MPRKYVLGRQTIHVQLKKCARKCRTRARVKLGKHGHEPLINKLIKDYGRYH